MIGSFEVIIAHRVESYRKVTAVSIIPGLASSVRYQLSCPEARAFTLDSSNDIISGGRSAVLTDGRRPCVTTYSSWNYALIGAFAASLIALLLYHASNRARETAERDRRARAATCLVAVEFVLLLAASAALLAAFLRHDFRLAYVTNYSSTSLPTAYLVSGFWAGQEGTFLLWATISGAIGLILAAGGTGGANGIGGDRSSSAGAGGSMNGGSSSWACVMRFYVLVHVALLVLLLRASPFRLLPVAPKDGAGLNPLLQDPWMVIHPPIVFIGYALYAVPFAYAMSALARDDYSGWVKPALAWTVAAWLFLGAGIIIGAKWAYATLGWGGYWGWDPVENASLVPWLAGAALMHTLIVQRESGRMVRTNIVLALASFLLVVYATYLTRSGVLSDFSVHSFSGLGISAFLVGACVLFAGLSLGMLAWRWRSMTANRAYKEPYEKVMSRDFAFFATALLLSASAAIVSLGTSAPLITRLSGSPSAVGAAFYNMTNAPLGFVLMLTLAVCPHLAYGGSEPARIGRAMIVPAVVALALTSMAVALGARGVWFVLFLFAAFLAFAGNLLALAKRARRRGGLRTVGGFAAHLGIALILVGVIATSAYSSSVTLTVRVGEEREVFGWRVRYEEREEFVAAGDSRPSVAWHLRVLRPGSDVDAGSAGIIAARPYMRPTAQGMLRHPAIVSSPTGDLYISPLDEDTSELGWNGLRELALKKGETAESAGLTVKFVGFDMSQHLGEDAMAVGAVLEVWDISSGQALGSVMPVLGFGAGGQLQTDALLDVDSRSVAFRLVSIDAGAGLAVIRMGEPLPEDEAQAGLGSVTLEISTKPFAGLLWVGAVLLLAGTALALVRRARRIP